MMKRIFLFIVLFLIFLSGHLYAATNKFDGKWYGTNPCDWLDEPAKVILIIQNGKTETSIGKYSSRKKFKGKVFKKFGSNKYKLGLNSSPGRIEGDFISDNKLIINKGKKYKRFGREINCEFTLTKNLNIKNKNKFLYCEDINGKVFASYRQCNFKEISKTEFDLKKNNNKKLNKIELSKNLNFYCKDRNGKVFNLDRPVANNLSNRCGNWMTEISINEYNSIKKTNKSKTKNKITVKKTLNSDQDQEIIEDYLWNWKYCYHIKNQSYYKRNKSCWRYGSVEISKTEWQNKSSKIKKNINISKGKENFYCKSKNGNVFTFDKPLHNNKGNKCGSMMKEISKSEFDSLENRKIVKTNTVKKSAQNNEITKQSIEIENDVEGPKILVDNKFEANNDLTASIQGQITDQSAIVSLIIDGDEVSMVNGSFNKELYVFPDGQEVQIIARDKHGNKSEITVQLVRSAVVVEEDKFDFLDPRKIKAKTNKNAVAIIIGIEDYENTFAAPFATNDAVTFNDFARLSLGIPTNNIKLLTNDEAERNDTLKVLRTWLPKKIIDNQTELYVFYSGHGLASDDGTDLYLLPADGEPDILEDTTILRNKIFDIIAELNPKRVTMFFDTCYSGATRDEEFLVAAKPIFIEAVEQDIPTNFNIFSASSGRETAKVLKEAKHGLFSYYMMKGLEGDADVNNDNQITNGELIAFVNKNVSRQANQTPQFNGDPDQVLVQW